MRSRILIRASTAAVLCLASGCAFLPAARGPRQVGAPHRASKPPAWTDFLACAVVSDTAAHGDLRDACGNSQLDAKKPTAPLPRPDTNTP